MEKNKIRVLNGPNVSDKGLFLLSFRAQSLFERPPEVSVDLQSGEFLGPLQYKTWRKMSSIFQPGMKIKDQHLNRT